MRYIFSFLLSVFLLSTFVSPVNAATCSCYNSTGTQSEKSVDASLCSASCSANYTGVLSSSTDGDTGCQCQGENAGTAYTEYTTLTCAEVCSYHGLSSTDPTAGTSSECLDDTNCLSGYSCVGANASTETLGRCTKKSEATTSGSSAASATTGVNLVNPLATSDVRVIMGTLIKAALGLSGSIALLMFILGGFLWLTAGGNAEKIEKGKQVLIWATIGLVVIFFAYTIVNAVISAITTGSVG